MLAGERKRIFRAICNSRSEEIPTAALLRHWKWIEAERLDAPVAHLLHSTAIPDRLGFLRGVYESNLARNIVIASKTQELFGRFHAAGISFAPLKGFYLLNTVYGIAERSMNDVDVLVRPEEIQKAIEIAVAMNYFVASPLPDKITHNRNINSVFLRENDGWFAVHLHWNIINTSAPSPSANPESIATDIWKGTVEIQREHFRFRALSSEATLIHLCEHAFKHSFSMMYLLLDICKFVHRVPIDGRAARKLAEKWGLLPVVATTLTLLSEEFPIPSNLASEFPRAGSSEIARLTAARFRVNGASVINYAAIQKSESDRIGFLKETFFPDDESLKIYGKRGGISGRLARFRNALRSITSFPE